MIKMIIACVCVLVFSGCERTDTDLVLVLEPENIQITEGESITVRASLPSGDDTRQIYYPLEWSLSDPDIGALRGAAGDTVVYEAGPFAGAGSITVRDQIGATGSASITQALTATNTATFN
jgi:hypothetical protein